MIQENKSGTSVMRKTSTNKALMNSAFKGSESPSEGCFHP